MVSDPRPSAWNSDEWCLTVGNCRLSVQQAISIRFGGFYLVYFIHLYSLRYKPGTYLWDSFEVNYYATRATDFIVLIVLYSITKIKIGNLISVRNNERRSVRRNYDLYMLPTDVGLYENWFHKMDNLKNDSAFVAVDGRLFNRFIATARTGRDFVVLWLK